MAPDELAKHIMTTRLAGHRGLLRIDLGIDVPVVGLGASAPSYYPAVSEKLGCPMVLSNMPVSPMQLVPWSAVLHFANLQR